MTDEKIIFDGLMCKVIKIIKDMHKIKREDKILVKIAQDELKELRNFWKRWYKIPGASLVDNTYNNTYQFFKNISEGKINTPYNMCGYYQYNPNDKDRSRTLLCIELKKLKKDSIINKEEHDKIRKMATSKDESMKSLAKVIVNKWRSKRIRKQNRKNKTLKTHGKTSKTSRA